MASGRKTSSELDGGAGSELAEAAGDLLPSGKLYYRIGEVSKITGVKTYVLRYWESEFRGMVPQKSRSKQRLYKRRDIEMIMLIKKLLYQERYTIAGAQQRIKELALARGTDAAEAADEPALQRPEFERELAKIDHHAEYARIKQDLVSLRALL